MQAVVRDAGGGLCDTFRLVVYVTDVGRYRPIVSKIQQEFWGGGPYPPRTFLEVSRSIRTTSWRSKELSFKERGSNAWA